jgi:hypothetical protein
VQFVVENDLAAMLKLWAGLNFLSQADAIYLPLTGWSESSKRFDQSLTVVPATALSRG